MFILRWSYFNCPAILPECPSVHFFQACRINRIVNGVIFCFLDKILLLIHGKAKVGLAKWQRKLSKKYKYSIFRNKLLTTSNINHKRDTLLNNTRVFFSLKSSLFDEKQQKEQCRSISRVSTVTLFKDSIIFKIIHE
jgi:hypothetical protein